MQTTMVTTSTQETRVSLRQSYRFAMSPSTNAPSLSSPYPRTTDGRPREGILYGMVHPIVVGAAVEPAPSATSGPRTLRLPYFASGKVASATALLITRRAGQRQVRMFVTSAALNMGVVMRDACDDLAEVVTARGPRSGRGPPRQLGCDQSLVTGHSATFRWSEAVLLVTTRLARYVPSHDASPGRGRELMVRTWQH